MKTEKKKKGSGDGKRKKKGGSGRSWHRAEKCEFKFLQFRERKRTKLHNDHPEREKCPKGEYSDQRVRKI